MKQRLMVPNLTIFYTSEKSELLLKLWLQYQLTEIPFFFLANDLLIICNSLATVEN